MDTRIRQIAIFVLVEVGKDQALELHWKISKQTRFIVYSQTSLIRTPKGPSEVRVLGRSWSEGGGGGGSLYDGIMF